MTRRTWRTAAVAGCCMAAAGAPAQELLKLDGDIAPVHDPVAIKERDTYYVFSTGGRNGEGVIPIRTSRDLRTWTRSGLVFDSLPTWTAREIPKATNAWAPDISFYNGRYHLYYSVSSFGSRDSAIGLTTTRTLDRSSPEFRWVDDGMVLRSTEKDDWNAIDPNLVIEDSNNIWLAWGSFWGGIKMRRIDPATGKLSASDVEMHSLSSRAREQPIGAAVEAPFIVRHNDYWYLFVSFDRCCRGAASTYNVVVGRSRRVTGPYVDRAGTRMTEGAGRSSSRRRRRRGVALVIPAFCARPGTITCFFMRISARGAVGGRRSRFRRWCGKGAGRAWGRFRRRPLAQP